MRSSTLIFGHQGWPSRYPSNTLAGFVAALPHVDGFELDVRRSGDGKLVLAHDPVMDSKVVASTPWALLAETDLGDGHKPALLDEALSALPGVPVQIEIKNDPSQPGFEPDHRLALEAAERARSIDVITSFNWASVGEVRRIFPEVRTGIILTRFFDLASALEHGVEAGHRVVAPEHTLIDEGMTVPDEIELTPWTVNDLARAENLAGLGVSAIITDDPLAMAPIRSAQ